MTSKLGYKRIHASTPSSPSKAPDKKQAMDSDAAENIIATLKMRRGANIEKSFSDLKATINFISEDIKELKGKMSHTEKRVGKAEEKIKTLENRVMELSRYKRRWNGRVITSVTDPKGHFVLLIVTFNDQLFLLGNLYGYNNKQDNITLIQLVNTKIDNLISNYTDLKNWNCSLNDNLDRWPNRSNDSNAYMMDFMNERDVVDIWRYKNPTVKEFTWKNKQGTLQSHIDYWLVSDSLSEYITTVKMLPTPLKDHKSIFIELGMSASRQSKTVNSYWKLNNTLIR